MAQKGLLRTMVSGQVMARGLLIPVKWVEVPVRAPGDWLVF